jgi:Ala-tRNA(Pro) deacylase
LVLDASVSKEVAMPASRVKAYLDAWNVEYEMIPYARAYDAQHVAAAAHISGKQLAKTVMIKVDDQLVMAVLPADMRVDCDRLRAALGVERAALAEECDFRDLFEDCQVGAMTPFGLLYGVDVFVDESLAQARSIAFRSGSHGELIRMAYADFAEMVTPHVLPLGYRR